MKFSTPKAESSTDHGEAGLAANGRITGKLSQKVTGVDYQEAFDEVLAQPSEVEALQAATSRSIGEEQAEVRRTASLMVRDHLVARGMIRVRPVIFSVGPAAAEVATCGPQEEVRVYHADTGELAENPNEGVAILIYQLTLQKGARRVWSISKVTPRTADTCPSVFLSTNVRTTGN